MEEQLISFKCAKLAKKVGYKPKQEWNPTYVPGYTFDPDTDEFPNLTEIQEEDYGQYGYYLAPTQSLLQKWLREVHKIDIDIDCGEDDENHWYSFYVYPKGFVKKYASSLNEDYTNNPDKYNFEVIIDYAETYEECLENALLFTLKYLQNEQRTKTSDIN